MQKAAQLERVARQYSAHRELQQHLAKSDLFEPYEDCEDHVQFYKVTPHTVFAERRFIDILSTDLRDEELANAIIEKYLP